MSVNFRTARTVTTEDNILHSYDFVRTSVPTLLNSLKSLNNGMQISESPPYRISAASVGRFIGYKDSYIYVLMTFMAN